MSKSVLNTASPLLLLHRLVVVRGRTGEKRRIVQLSVAAATSLEERISEVGDGSHKRVARCLVGRRREFELIGVLHISVARLCETLRCAGGGWGVKVVGGVRRAGRWRGTSVSNNEVTLAISQLVTHDMIE